MNDDLVFTVIREPSSFPTAGESFTLGKVYQSGIYFCESCEDRDRRLEDGGIKVATKTAIPRGKYKLITSMSNRFKRELPEVLDVPQFKGIRLHGGNKAENSEGCILIGKVRTSTGIAQCADTVNAMIAAINSATKAGRKCFIEVK